MRQHAIPQNILDIEFKLFTKFTIREFVYLAVGIGFGGIFIYLFSSGDLPAVVAFPIFALSAGLGIFLGLVKINDQPADIFIRNFFYAITHPTQRVWKNEIIDEKIDKVVKPDFNLTEGKNDRGAVTPTGGKTIGISKDLPSNQFIEKSKIDEIDKEEKEKLDSISQLAGVPVQPTLKRETIIPTASPISNSNRITISKINSSSMTAKISNKNPGGNLNFKVCDNEGNGIAQAVIVIKDSQDKILSAFRSNSLGEITSEKMFSPGMYNLEIQAGGNTFPPISVLIEDVTLPPIKLMAI
ncbi:PrgI family protein [Candidatus Dojkabacteria bacterium]|jgi:hypothetical protein|nr:PrgI family protein [Candidatus Dojkabacteria bacterium]